MEPPINVHGRINHRANLVNFNRAYGQLPEGYQAFANSFDLDGNPEYDQLYRYERLGHYNNHKGYYN